MYPLARSQRWAEGIASALRVIILRQQKRATNPEAHWVAFP